MATTVEGPTNGRGHFDLRELGSPPDRSRAQWLAALKEANRIRSARAELKRAAKTGSVDLLEVVADPPPELDTMKVYGLLLAMPKVGRVKANKTLAMVKVSPGKTVGGLSPRQRRELVGVLAGRR